MNNKSNIFFYVFITIIILLIALLQYQLWFSNTGLLSYKTLSSNVRSESQKVKNKTQTNIKLYSEVVSLRNNSEVLESLARQNMGLIKKGEIFYSVK